MVWAGCYASQADAQVVMANPAINGYHSVVSYQWELDGSSIPGEDTPLLFAEKAGVYSCHIIGPGETNYKKEFRVSSKQKFVLD